MTSPDALLDEIADAVLDGTPLDWGDVAARVDADTRTLIDELRFLATLRRSGEMTPARAAQLERWGHLHVLERVGHGAYGTVYRAWDPRLDREVALKLLHGPHGGDAPEPSVIEEGRLLARIRHPNVVTIYGAECMDGRIGLWMEFVNGRTLEERVRQGGPLPADEVRKVGVDLCSAVAAVHAAGLVHRDIKAQNIIGADDGRLVLMDFGTGLELQDGPASAAAGTPLYLAPEVLAGAPATVQSDVYAIGVVLYRLLTGAYPVSASDMDGLRDAHARRERTSLRSRRSGIPARLLRVVEQALDPEPSRRHVNAESFREALAAVGAASPLRIATYAATAALALVGVLWASGGFGTKPPVATLAAPAAAAMAPPIAIAVLPFRALSAAPETVYFADGLTEEIIRNLATSDALALRSQTSTAFFRDQPVDAARIAEQLQVGMIVTGSVQRDGPMLRVAAQLVSVPGDVVMWSERYDRSVDELFQVQDDISRAIAGSLRVSLVQAATPHRPSVSAFELYQQARARVVRRGPDDVRQAVGLFEQIIAMDPAYALAYAGLADAHATLSWRIPDLPPEEGLRRMRPAAQKALELDPQLAEAHGAMGLTLARELDWQGARDSFERAIALNPSLTHIQTNYSYSTLLPTGDVERALQLLDAAVVADPLSFDVRRERAYALIAAGRFEEAVTQLRELLAVDPDLPGANLQLARALAFAGRPQEAIALWESRPQNDTAWQRWMTHAYVRLGRQDQVARLVEANRNDHPYRQALVYAALGDVDRTFAALDRAVTLMPQRTALLLALPEMALLGGDPRLQALRKRLQLS